MSVPEKGRRVWLAPGFLIGLLFTAVAIAIFFGASVAVRIQSFMDPSSGPSALALVPPFFLTGVVLILVAMLRRRGFRGGAS